jgi:hypothetical protein
MLEYNFNPKVLTKVKSNSIYFIENFYKNPKEVLNLLNNKTKIIHKLNDLPSFNMFYFQDQRHSFYHQELEPIIKDIEKLINKKYLRMDSGENFFTNCQMWYDHEFNDYKNNYWWPHLDLGWTALIYLNDDETSGTNLYEYSDDHEDQIKTHEHLKPWRSKKLWNKIYTIPSKLNRLVLFKADDIFHGAEVNNKYTETFRINQALFFNK